jgi:hypothetical protein
LVVKLQSKFKGGFMGFLSREEIFKKQDREYAVVNCPEWGGKVRVQSLSGAERDAFEESILGKRKEDGSRDVMTANLRAKLVALSAVDKDGNLLFGPDDWAALGQKNAAPLDRLFTAAQKLSGISKNDVEELTKNSGLGQKEDSTSDLPSTSGA